MPQLNKGGKFVFGLSVIRPDLTIHIPPQALSEYDAVRDGKVIIFTGSKITGGFCVTTYSLLSNSKLKHILEDCFKNTRSKCSNRFYGIVIFSSVKWNFVTKARGNGFWYCQYCFFYFSSHLLCVFCFR